MASTHSVTLGMHAKHLPPTQAGAALGQAWPVPLKVPLTHVARLAPSAHCDVVGPHALPSAAQPCSPVVSTHSVALGVHTTQAPPEHTGVVPEQVLTSLHPVRLALHCWSRLPEHRYSPAAQLGVLQVASAGSQI